MRIETTDPISGNTIHNLDGKPFVVEGQGEGALKIYFENEANKRPTSKSRPSTRERTSPPTSTIHQRWATKNNSALRAEAGGGAQCPRRMRFRQWAHSRRNERRYLGRYATVSEWPPPRVAIALGGGGQATQKSCPSWRTDASLRRRYLPKA